MTSGFGDLAKETVQADYQSKFWWYMIRRNYFIFMQNFERNVENLGQSLN